jgi:two-component system phosphate regulon sensor histidine kinase PhoR
MLRYRILWKLFSGYVVLILLSTILVGVLVSRQVEEETLVEIEQSLDVRATLLRAVALESFSSNTKAQKRIQTLGLNTNTRFTIIKPDGTVFADSEENLATMDNHANRAEILAARSHGHGITTRFSDTVDKKMMYYALPVKRESFSGICKSISSSLSNR